MTTAPVFRRGRLFLAEDGWAVLAVALTATVVRLAVLPLATTDGSDAPGRVWNAWAWMADPGVITSGVWGPLHTYLIAAAMAVMPDPVRAPVILSAVLSVAGAVAMYPFVLAQFESRRAALLVALAFAMYPIAIRNGVSVRSETPFALFLLFAMTGVTLARRDQGSWRHAAFGGLALTLASMLRYEGWMLTPFFAMLLWRKPKLLLVFVACAAIHPVLWMIGNTLAHGDPLYSMTWASRWELEGMGRARLGRDVLMRKAAAYPLLALQGMTWPFAVLSVGGAALALTTRHRARVWLIPLCGMMWLWMAAVARGSLVPKLNYTETAGVLLFPFAAVAYERLGGRRWPRVGFAGFALALLALAALSLCRPCLDRIGLGKLAGISPVPTIPNQSIALTLPPILLANMDAARSALITDHYGWGPAHYVALLTRLPPDRIFMASGAPNRRLDTDRLTRFLARNPEGVLIGLSGSRFSDELGLRPGAASATAGSISLALEPVRDVSWPGKPDGVLTVFRYRVDSASAGPATDAR
jgi:hypothetical protein